jgi:hypothetical protein
MLAVYISYLSGGRAACAPPPPCSLGQVVPTRTAPQVPAQVLNPTNYPRRTAYVHPARVLCFFLARAIRDVLRLGLRGLALACARTDLKARHVVW